MGTFVSRGQVVGGVFPAGPRRDRSVRSKFCELLKNVLLDFPSDNGKIATTLFFVTTNVSQGEDLAVVAPAVSIRGRVCRDC